MKWVRFLSSVVLIFALFTPSVSEAIGTSITTHKKVQAKDWKLPEFNDTNYKVALAYSDGTYAFVKDSETNSFKVASKKAIDIRRQYNYDYRKVVPTVVNRNGFVVYATSMVGKVAKVNENNVQTSGSATIDLYTSETSSKAHTTVNTSFIDDVPIIEIRPTRVKVMLNGYEGWVNKALLAKDFDLLIIPFSHVKSFSTYSVNDKGQLVHFISEDITSTKGTSIIIGKAPNSLEKGKIYYSYDGQYFYASLPRLVQDLKDGKRSSAVNKTAFKNYYQYQSLQSTSSYNASQFNSYINKHIDKKIKDAISKEEQEKWRNSKLKNSGQYFIEAEKKHGVNAALMLSIAIHESGWGTSKPAQQHNNLFNIAVTDGSTHNGEGYATVQEAIHTFAKVHMNKRYLNPDNWVYHGPYVGNKKEGINVRYATDPFWGEKVAKHAFSIEVNILK